MTSLRLSHVARSLPLAVKFAAACVLVSGLTTHVHALSIVPTFDSSFSSAANPVSAENAVQTAIAAVDSLYGTAGSIPVLFKYDSGLGGGAETNSALSTYSYNTWRSQLQTISTGNPTDTVLSTAVGSLPTAGSVSQQMSVTAVYGNLIMGSSLFLGFDSSGNFNGSGGQSYAAVVTVSAPSTIGSFYTSGTGINATATSVAEHELDEVLGGGGAGTTLTSSSTGTPTQYGTLDLYRYLSGNGTDGTGHLGALSWSASSSILTYLSINGGTSAVLDAQGKPIGFNQTGGGADYADFASVSGDGHIQDAFVPSSSVANYTTSSPEATMMEAIGYTVPEPAAVTMLVGAFAGLVLARRRRAGRVTG